MNEPRSCCRWGWTLPEQPARNLWRHSSTAITIKATPVTGIWLSKGLQLRCSSGLADLYHSRTTSSMDTRNNPAREKAFPTREKGTPAREETFPTRERGTPAREEAFPTRERGTPAREEAFPTRERGTPAREETFPTRERGTPAREETFPTRE